MKYLFMLLLAAPARANPYFRTPFSGGPTVHYEGAFIDPKDPGQTTLGSEVALVTHDPKDGCALPEIVCEQWSPIATGLSVNGGRVYWDIGPTVNVFPWMLNGLSAIGIPTSFKREDANGAFAFGPKLGLNPISDAKLQPFNQWQPRLLLMTALQLRWN